VDEENQQLKLRALMKHKEFLWDCTQDGALTLEMQKQVKWALGHE
jgi:hypothetical protein